MNKRSLSLKKNILINYNHSNLKENQIKNSFSPSKSNNYINQSTLNESTKKDSIQINYLPQLNNKTLNDHIQTYPNFINNNHKMISYKFKSPNPLRLKKRISNKRPNIFKIRFSNDNKNYNSFRQSIRKNNSKPKGYSEINNYFNDNKENSTLEGVSNLKSYNNKIGFNKNKIDYDYSLMIKKLDNWDKVHCFKNKDDLFSLYNTLSEYYKNNKLFEDQNNLNYMNSMLKEKINYSKYKENKTYDVWNNKQKENNIKSDSLDINEQNKGFILSSSIINNLNKDYGKNKIDIYSKMMRERINYENQLHHELIFVNNIIINKKLNKKEKNEELNKLFIELNKLKSDFNQKSAEYTRMYHFRLEQYTFQYDSLVTEKLNEVKQINENIKEIKENSSVLKKFEKKKTKQNLTNEVKELEFMHKNRISIINAEMKRDMEKLKSEYKSKLEELKEKKENDENQIKILNEEINYYKSINEELAREYELYYLDILKKGSDCRKDGLVWVVKNLLELGINLEYHHFPKFLTHEQINYLRKLALLILEENELKIILKILKKRQRNNRENENIEYMNLFDTISSDKIIQNKNEIANKEIEKKEIKTYEEELLIIKKKIDKKFSKVYKDNEDILKLYFEKILEEEKIQNFFYYIKKALYSDNNNDFLNQNKVSIIDAFMGKTKNKDLFELIINISKRLEEIDKTKKYMMKKEKENYIEKFINNANIHTNNYFYNKELIKNGLFGNKIEF